MPLYDYECGKCKHVYDLLLSKISTAAEEAKHEKCPKCGSKRKKKMISRGTGFILNGSGWCKKHYG